MPEVGGEIRLQSGPFAGTAAVLLELGETHARISFDPLGMGRPTEMWVALADLGATEPRPVPMKALVDRFDGAYRSQAPQRYARLQPGISRGEVEGELRDVLPDTSTLPLAYFELYAWKNGFMTDDPSGWSSEFEEDAWHEDVPLGSGATLLSVQDAKALMTADTPRPRSMDGLVPFLWIRPWQITFVDVTGRAGGMPGQIIVSNEGTLTIIHQSLERWLETQLAWLEEGILFQNPEPLRRDAIHARLNGPFGTDFHRLVD